MKIGEYIHNLFGKLPPWAYVAIIGGGIAAAVILPKFFGGTGNQTTASNGSDTTAAIDPNTGLPYPISGYPGGAFAGGSSTPINDGQQASSADTAALIAELQKIEARLNPAPTQGGNGTTGVGTTHTTKPATTNATSTASAARAPTYPDTQSIFINTQPSLQSIASAKGSSAEIQKQTATVNQRLLAAEQRLGG
jgi:hypothetical protein